MVKKSEVGQFLGVCVLELFCQILGVWKVLVIEEFGGGQILGVWKVLLLESASGKCFY